MGHFLGVALGGEHLHTIKEKSVHFDSSQQDVITLMTFYVDDVIIMY